MSPVTREPIQRYSLASLLASFIDSEVSNALGPYFTVWLCGL